MSSTRDQKDNKSPSQTVIKLFSEMYCPMGISSDVLKPKAKQFCKTRGLSYKDMVNESMTFYKSLSHADQSHARLRHVFTIERTKCVISGKPFRWSDQQGYSIHTGSVCIETFFSLLYKMTDVFFFVSRSGIPLTPFGFKKAFPFWPFTGVGSTKPSS